MSTRQRPYKFIISGGGTGGHIFPAIAIAHALRERHPDAEILFVGAKGRMEMEKVPAAGYPIEGLWISGLQRKLTARNLAFPFKLVSSLLKARSVIGRFKPDAVIGVGGYASGPTLRMAARQGIPTLIQEQNSYPGITNKLLAGKVNTICVAYDGMERYFPARKIIKTGNPVRRQVIDIAGKKDEAARYFGLSADMPTLFIVGGSQGALSVNRSISGCLYGFLSKGYQVIWQTGKHYLEEARSQVLQSGSRAVVVTEFIDRMDLAYAMADVIISRAGAMAISEICAVAIPPIFVPFPAAAEDHQTRNAQALVEKGAAILVPDREAAGRLGPAALELLADEARKRTLGGNLKKLAITDADERIAEEVLKLVNA